MHCYCSEPQEAKNEGGEGYGVPLLFQYKDLVMGILRENLAQNQLGDSTNGPWFGTVTDQVRKLLHYKALYVLVRQESPTKQRHKEHSAEDSIQQVRLAPVVVGALLHESVQPLSYL
jgi:hypothetical protein